MLKYIPLVCIIFLASCAPRIYFPDAVNAPAFQHAHEIRAAGSVKPQIKGRGNISHSADAAYAATPHVGIIASYRNLNSRYGYLYPERYTYTVPKTPYHDVDGLISGQYFDLGAGYFRRIRTKGLVEVYAGYGNGTLSADTDPKSMYNQHFFDARYHRFFLMGNAGFRIRNICATGGVKYSMQHYYDFHDEPALYAQQQGSWGFTPIAGKNFWFVQPFGNIELGYQFIFFNIQYGFCGQVFGHYNDILGDSNFYLSFGASARLGNKAKEVHRRRYTHRQRFNNRESPDED